MGIVTTGIHNLNMSVVPKDHFADAMEGGTIS